MAASSLAASRSMGVFFFLLGFVVARRAMFRVTAGREANKHSHRGELVRQMARAQLSCLRHALTFGVLEVGGGGGGGGWGAGWRD